MSYHSSNLNGHAGDILDFEILDWDFDRPLINLNIRRKGIKVTDTLKRSAFKGTRTVWEAGDGRKIPVSKLDTEHLANIIEYLRTRAREELSKNSFLGIYHSVNDIEGYLFENHITYPELRSEAQRRGIWDEEKIYVGPKQTLEYVKHDKFLPVSRKLDILIKLIETVLAQ